MKKTNVFLYILGNIAAISIAGIISAMLAAPAAIGVTSIIYPFLIGNQPTGRPENGEGLIAYAIAAIAFIAIWFVLTVFSSKIILNQLNKRLK